MYTDSEGIILKQVKTVDNRRIIVVLTEKYGKISAGTSIPEKGKNKSSLALRPFTKGKYELYKNKEYFNINGAEVVKSYYSIGEDIDKYIAASYVLELTDKISIEGEKADGLYKLLSGFLDVISKRPSEFDTLVIAFQIKALSICGLCLSQNPLMLEESNDKISIVKYIENHSIDVIKDMSIEEKNRVYFIALLKKYIYDNLGIGDLKSEILSV